MSQQALQDYIYTTKYARHLPEKKRRELFAESVDRVLTMYEKKFADCDVKDDIEFCRSAMKDRLVLGSQRALQFGGAPIEKKNARMYNCGKVTTPFVTAHGVKTFADFTDGETVTVLSHTGEWRSAIVRSFGKQPLQKITIGRGTARHEVEFTVDHRWLLRDGSETTALKVGDQLLGSPNIFRDFDYYDASGEERMWWAYGFVYGDGTCVKNKSGEYTSSMVRLCGEKRRFADRFEELGFSVSFPLSNGGDPVFYTGRYLKAPPAESCTPGVLRAFVAGYLDADGERDNNADAASPFRSIQVTGEEAIEFVRRAFPAAGCYIVSEAVQATFTNLGDRTDTTVRFRLTMGQGRTAATFKVLSIEPTTTETVWCLEVDHDHSFVLPFGLTTGNCTTSYCDRPRFFQECLWLLLCGCGTGFSVQKHHIAKLPPLVAPNRAAATTTMTIPDTIEGWADSLGVLLATYGIAAPEFAPWAGLNTVFDFSAIRPKGASLSSGSGKAPGPGPMKGALEEIRELLDRCVAAGRTHLRTIDAYDIVMHASDAVLSGGVRRSATICLFSVDDQDMMSAKTGKWFIENPQRGRSNNSAVLLRETTSWDTFAEIMKSTKEFGEPGFVWSDSTEIMYNPCQPASAPVITESGLRCFGDIKVGDRIWSKEGWTTVVKKWKTGVKKVYRYDTSAGFFLGTDKHRVVSKGVKVEVGQAESIEVLRGPRPDTAPSIAAQDVLDGLVLGDGTVQGDTQLLCIGENDRVYHQSEVAALIGKGYSGPYTHKIRTGVSVAELPLTYLRRIPQRYTESTSRVCSVLRGLFSANGSCHSGRVTLKASSHGMIQDAQLFLSSLGIKSYVTTNKTKPVEFSNGTYVCRESYDLNITNDIATFERLIGFIQPYKQDKLRLAVLSRSGSHHENDRRLDHKILATTFIGEEDVFDITVDNDSHTYWTGGLNVSNCVEIGLYPCITVKDLADMAPAAVDHIVDPRTGEQATRTVSGWAFCVSGDTKLITRTGITSIKDAVGVETEVWNGKRWSTVTPFETGKDRKLYRVRFSDGSHLDATANHKWLVKDRFMVDYKEVQTVDLMAVSKYPIHIPRANVVMDGGKHEDSAYEYGVLLGDGDVRHDHAARVQLYGRKKALPVRGSRGIDHDEYQTVTLTDVDQDFARTLKWSGSLPSELFAWDRDSILCFVAGWADTDGSQASNGIRIYGQEHRLRDLQLLLTKAGIDCSVNLMAEAGAETNFGHRQQDMWYAQVTDAREIPCHRLDVSKGKPATCKGKHQIITSVEELSGLHDTFCLTEDEAHLCVFNNVLTKQCNLCEINAKKCTDIKTWLRAATAAAILGTFQASFTSFDYLGPVSEAIAKREALLGVSMTGIMDNPKLVLDAHNQREVAKHILDVNERIAHKIGILPTARATCVKPAGTTSCILGTSSGIHPHHAKRYMRRAQGNELEAPLQYYALHNPKHVEKSVWSKNNTDKSVIFCIETDDDAHTKETVSALKLLEFVKLTQMNWVDAGRVPDRCSAPFLRHNVSNTINIKPDEWDDVAKYIYDNREHFAGISLIAHAGDRDYPQAPFCQVFTPKEIVTMYGDGSLMASGLIVDGLHAFGDNLWAACDCALGIGEDLNGPYDGSFSLDQIQREHAYRSMKRDWIRRAKKFADNYFNCDMKQMTYCLKDVSNWKLWCDLNRVYQPVDWEMLLEDTDGTKDVTLDAACAGGKCEVLTT